ncbi:MAG TPA: DegT/DnrJ/EryC1/StrS family aminotransferase [Bacillota bacterium]|nr:DegT/DnrJ/EryC1/StrS family aminotransferase [Bacillota bacterium]
MKKNIYVTQPALPPLAEFVPYLEEIWESHVLTNNGQFHKQLERELCEYLGVRYISLFCNATIALITALQALEITGEVITTPFSFVATANSLVWNGIKPVFADIESDTFNLDPTKIEALLTPKTTALMPVHVYGNPCNVAALQDIADRHGLKIIYDAAHAFAVKLNGESVLNYGDLSILSFHATKTYTTIEGGAIICHDEQMKRRIDNLKNFGFTGETSVIAAGINGKMNELQAAFGLVYLKHIDEYIEKRKRITEIYRERLDGVKGLRIMQDLPGVTHNYSYFPILINADEYGKNRDEVYEKLKSEGIYSRRYFYPLISQFPPYQGLETAQAGKLPVAERVAQEVLCLPIYPELEEIDINRVIKEIRG